MKSIRDPVLLEKAKRRYRSERARDPSLPALIAGTGELLVDGYGHAFAALPQASGSMAIYVLTRRDEYRICKVGVAEAVRSGTPLGDAAPVTVETAMKAVDMMAAIERHAANQASIEAAQASAMIAAIERRIADQASIEAALDAIEKRVSGRIATTERRIAAIEQRDAQAPGAVVIAATAGLLKREVNGHAAE
jgi:hypothetical protein